MEYFLCPGFAKLDMQVQLQRIPRRPIDFGNVQLQSLQRHSAPGIYSLEFHRRGPPTFQMPDFDQDGINGYNDGDEPETVLEDLLRYGYSRHEYLVTEAHDDTQRKELGLCNLPLTTSERLLNTAKHIPGIHSSYCYVSRGVTVTSFHVEDFHLCSKNLLLAGQPKLWLLVNPLYGGQLEAKIHRHFSDSSLCSQFVRHHNVVIAPSLLREWGIPFQVVAQNVGETIHTAPRTYHYVMNTGSNMAEAVNYCHESWEPEPQYDPCSDTCCDTGPIAASDMVITSFHELNVQTAHRPGVRTNLSNRATAPYPTRGSHRSRQKARPSTATPLDEDSASESLIQRSDTGLSLDSASSHMFAATEEGDGESENSNARADALAVVDMDHDSAPSVTPDGYQLVPLVETAVGSASSHKRAAENQPFEVVKKAKKLFTEERSERDQAADPTLLQADVTDKQGRVELMAAAVGSSRAWKLLRHAVSTCSGQLTILQPDISTDDICSLNRMIDEAERIANWSHYVRRLVLARFAQEYDRQHSVKADKAKANESAIQQLWNESFPNHHRLSPRKSNGQIDADDTAAQRWNIYHRRLAKRLKAGRRWFGIVTRCHCWYVLLLISHDWDAKGGRDITDGA